LLALPALRSLEADAVCAGVELLLPLDAELPRGTARAPLPPEAFDEPLLPDAFDPLLPDERGAALWPSDAVLTRGLLPSL